MLFYKTTQIFEWLKGEKLNNNKLDHSSWHQLISYQRVILDFSRLSYKHQYVFQKKLKFQKKELKFQIRIFLNDRLVLEF